MQVITKMLTYYVIHKSSTAALYSKFVIIIFIVALCICTENK